MIVVDEVTKRFGATTAVDAVSFAIRENEFFALLGPSGCGKTTLLRVLAGLEQPDSGRLLLDGEDLVGVPARRRPLNMMFQSYALFPHMSVRDNVGYGLRMERVARGELAARVDEALAMVQMSDLAGRRPAQLSGGQRQRVALARALVKRPRVLLLDEPLSALDRQIRGEMQIELKRLQHAVGITFVVVTHDQEEALTMADRIAVMRDGRVLQLGAPDELYERPADRFVAGFLGESNLFVGRVSEGPALVPAGGGPALALSRARVAEAGLRAGEEAAVLVRPERVVLGPASDGLVSAGEGVVLEAIYLGEARKYVVEVGGRSVVARLPASAPPLHAGERVTVGWSAQDGVLVPAA